MSHWNPQAETRPWPEQATQDDAAYRAQIAYLSKDSAFYRNKLTEGGFRDAPSVGGLADIANLPMTEKDELRETRTQDSPIGTCVAAPMDDVIRIYSTSGTTGTPCYIPLTATDLENRIEISRRSYGASGVAKGDRMGTTFNAGMFVAGVTLDAFARLGLCHIPVGAGDTERLMAAAQSLKPAKVTEAMGIGDISVSLWSECDHQDGIHFSGRGIAHFELIDPDTGATVPLQDGAEGELVDTHLKHRAAPLLRVRSRDHVRISLSPCGCGRTAPRVRCIGRTDDMLILRGVNLFPTPLRQVVNEFQPLVSGVTSVQPSAKGVKQEPPLPLKVELAEGAEAPHDLADRIRQRVEDKLIVMTAVTFVAQGSPPRSDYKSKLIDWSEAS